jgi:hypothetical protein
LAATTRREKLAGEAMRMAHPVADEQNQIAGATARFA